MSRGTPNPDGIVARVHAPGAWYYVEWNPVTTGGDVVYESEHQGEGGHVNRDIVPRSALIAVAAGTTRYTRIRNVVNGAPSSWVSVTLNDRGEIVAVDGDPSPNPDPDPDPAPVGKPGQPGNLRVSDVGADSVLVSWDAPTSGAAVDHYYLTWSADGGSNENTSTVDTSFRITGLTAGTHYALDLYAVTAAGESSTRVSVSWKTTAGDQPTPDPNPPEAKPQTPANVRAHCITYQSTKLEWDRDPTIHEYEVWIDGHRDQAMRTQDTLVTIRDLKPSTTYTAYVVAHTRDGQQSDPGSVRFKTGVPEPTPDPGEDDGDVVVGAEWDAPELQVWPLEGGKVRATWIDPATPDKPVKQMGYPFWHVSLDQKTWYFTRDREYVFEVAPGAEVMVSVYGVWDDTLTAIATKGVAL